MDKTNVMRILDAKKAEYTPHEYDKTVVDGESVAKMLNQPPQKVFKTLVTVGNNLQHYVFLVPVAATLDLKKAAKIVGAKSVEMIKQKDLLPLTGYIHGGCSPIGMKKQFKTVIDQSATTLQTICVSAGRVGCQIELDPRLLGSIFLCQFGDLV